MRISFLVLSMFLSTSASVYACPRLEGRFLCRSNPQFELTLRSEFQNGMTVYTFSDPNITQSLIPDGTIREMEFRSGKGTYVASCMGNRLIMDVRDPQGNQSHDQYYIERAALVRVRTSPGRLPESLSCKPIAGTWKLYPPF